MTLIFFIIHLGLKSIKNAAQRLSPKTTRKKPKATVALMKVYPNELEAQQEFDGFTEWLQTFELYRYKISEHIQCVSFGFPQFRYPEVKARV